MRSRLKKVVSVLMLVSLVAGTVMLHQALSARGEQSAAMARVTGDAAVALRSISTPVSGTATSPVHPGKPWVDDLAAYASIHPGHWIVGHCAKPCLSQAEAEYSAAADAAGLVYPIVQRSLHSSQADQRWLLQQISADVTAGRLQEDHLLESFTRPYGTLWTQTVLLDASPDKLSKLLGSYHTKLVETHARSNGIHAGAIGVVLFAWIGYLLTNAITRGYFTLRLQLLAGTITALAMVVLLGGT